MSTVNGYDVITGTNQTPPFRPDTPVGLPKSGLAEAFADAFNALRKEADPNGKSAHEPGSKLDHGKCAAGVLHDFALALQAIANVGDFGMKKYTRGGWQSVPNGEQRYADAMWRHLLKSRHEDIDPDSGLPHLDHMLWNLAAVVEMRKRVKAGA